MCRFSRIDCIEVGIHFEGGTLQKACKEIGKYYVKYDKHSNICEVQPKEFCFANKTFLQDALSQMGTLNGFRDVSELVKNLADHLKSEISSARTEEWNAFSADKQLSEVSSISFTGAVMDEPNFIHRITTAATSPLAQ